MDEKIIFEEESEVFEIIFVMEGLIGIGFSFFQNKMEKSN